jgi:hypothetical protein
MLDFNDAEPTLPFIDETEARLALQLAEFTDLWLFYKQEDERYDPRDLKAAFLKTCSEEFDRQLQWGPACLLTCRSKQPC